MLCWASLIGPTVGTHFSVFNSWVHSHVSTTFQPVPATCALLTHSKLSVCQSALSLAHGALPLSPTAGHQPAMHARYANLDFKCLTERFGVSCERLRI